MALLNDEKNAAKRLRELMERAVAESDCDSILFSGGLDTSVVATVAAGQGRKLQAFTVLVKQSGAADAAYAEPLAKRLGMTHVVLRPTARELLDEMPQVVRVLKTFDPMELRNSVAAYAGLKAAKEHGRKSVLTGDGSDELFAGYSYVFQKPPAQLREYLTYLASVMQFSAFPLGKSLGLGIRAPFLDEPVKQFALTLDASLLVREVNGVTVGKYVVRKAFEHALPPEFTWRVKTPLETGSGSALLTRTAADLISDEAFAEEKTNVLETDGVRLRDKEQLCYYRVYKKTFGPPQSEPGAPKSCRACHSALPTLHATFCTTCGEYPA